MKMFVTAGLFGALALANPALAQEAAPQAAAPSAQEAPPSTGLILARRIVDQGFPEDLREEMFFASVDQLTKQFATSDYRMKELIKHIVCCETFRQ